MEYEAKIKKITKCPNVRNYGKCNVKGCGFCSKKTQGKTRKEATREEWPDWEKEIFLRRSDISTWMRNWGVDDGDNFSAEEVQELIEDFWDDSGKLFSSLLSKERERAVLKGERSRIIYQLKEEAREEVIEDIKKWAIEENGITHKVSLKALLDFLSTKEKKI